MVEMTYELTHRINKIARTVSDLEEELVKLIELRDEIHHLVPEIEEYMTQEQVEALDELTDLWEFITDRGLQFLDN